MSAWEGVVFLNLGEAFGFAIPIAGETDLVTPFLRTGWLCGLDVERLLEVAGAFGTVDLAAM